MQQQRKISREIGTAFAVLALYLLTLLAPLHQARATQLDFARLGYAITDAGWVLCTPQGAVDETGKLTVSKCPATGIGKQDLVEPSPAVQPLPVARPALLAPLSFVQVAVIDPPAHRPLGARAPPVTV